MRPMFRLYINGEPSGSVPAVPTIGMIGTWFDQNDGDAVCLVPDRDTVRRALPARWRMAYDRANGPWHHGHAPSYRLGHEHQWRSKGLWPSMQLWRANHKHGTPPLATLEFEPYFV